MNHSAVALRKGLLLAFDEIESVEIFRCGFEQYFKIGLFQGESLTQGLSEGIAEYLSENKPAGLLSRFGTEDPGPGLVAFPVPERLIFIAEAGGLTSFDIVSSLNVLFPGSLICDLEEDFGSHSFIVKQQHDGRDLDIAQLNAVIPFITVATHWTVSRVEKVSEWRQSGKGRGVDIIPSGLLQKSPWRDAAERDEEFVSRYQLSALDGSLRFDPERKATAFVADHGTGRQDVRPLLATFDRVVLWPGKGSDWNLDISQDEAFRLIERNKLVVASPRNPSMANSDFIARVASQYPTSLIGPRAAGLFVLSDSVRRNPLLQLLIREPESVHAIIKAFKKVEFPDAKMQEFVHGMLNHFVSSSMEILHFNFVRGSLASGLFGLGADSERAYALITGDKKDLRFEFMAVGEVAQLGSSLDAVSLPWEGELSSYFDFIAKTTNVSGDNSLSASDMTRLLHELHVPVYYDMDIDQYVDLFNGDMTKELREVLSDVVRTCPKGDDFERKLRSFREKADEIETRRAQIAKINVVGTAAGLLPLHWPIAQFIMKQGLKRGMDEVGRITSVRDFTDNLSAKAFEADIAAVRLARIRTEIKRGRFGSLLSLVSGKFLKK